ncbi:hypothetical protein [Williamsia sp. CHRR-6]|uniref:hypothetical protein n=1 Tax=Williamsia sp. CHRR-6 TaxID=2835871 RepID=UPI001BD94956|nr:hypothetical protein [Williamsia sp. CHRR-6]MBT0566489.1 hypothetical protein [Williamsia sp. CHRR-6]
MRPRAVMVVGSVVVSLSLLATGCSSKPKANANMTCSNFAKASDSNQRKATESAYKAKYGKNPGTVARASAGLKIRAYCVLPSNGSKKIKLAPL